jgi:acetyl esterase/lipase
MIGRNRVAADIRGGAPVRAGRGRLAVHYRQSLAGKMEKLDDECVERRCSSAQLSRRSCLPLLAAVVLSPVLPARAGDVWQAYRRDDLGFEVEMPGTPKIEVEESQDQDDPSVKSVSAEVTFEDTLFAAGYQEYRRPTSVEEEVVGQRWVARTMPAKIASETRFVMNGQPGVEVVFDGMGGTAFMIVRIVVAGNRRFLVSVIGSQGGPDNPSARRFLNSFKLLPSRP